MLSVLTFSQFPTSPLALRSNDPAEQDRRRAFAGEMAVAANTARDQLADLWSCARGIGQRMIALAAVHGAVTDWRHRHATTAPGRVGTGLTFDVERFRTPITDTTANYDRIGHVGRMRDGATWHQASRTYRGGTPTPASLAMAHYGSEALRRFEREAPDADILQNWVTLPGGELVAGNRILRGGAARTVAVELTARIEARGLDTGRVETGGDPIYTATPTAADGDRLFTEALRILARPTPDHQAFLLARYLLFQAPRTKKGSDAVTRVFTVAAGSLLLGDGAPPLHADADLRAYVLGQHTATRP